MQNTKSYSELRGLDSFEDRFRYLSLNGQVGDPTFGWERYLNQRFYNSAEWRRTRQLVIIRDNGCDLGIEGRELFDRVYIHHMNPMRPDDLREFNPDVLNPEFLISVSHNTHNAIHFGDENHLTPIYVERRPGDHKLW